MTLLLLPLKLVMHAGLNSDGSDITGGPGITDTASGGTVTIAADLTANGGLSVQWCRQ